jgi:hypothetical protein
MLTGFYFSDYDGEIWWEKSRNLYSYAWVFRDGHGTGCSMIFTYAPR